ncbi:unnamed protein product [Brachionus calyciflorus]|uniref:K Homology domain-containing protein n=1 Tax=Brachionus calyciflorus TaxID=104777 RepID=A0A814HSP9_9BILA|nr:unnamed protein product [Brachionus calyciflorus]
MENKDIQSAIERARAVAARLTQQIPDKRPASDSSYDAPAKKFASVNDAVGAQLAMLKSQQLGGGSSSDDMRVPDKLVGLVIGKGGDQLHKLQGETQTKIVIAPEPGHNNDRTFTIIGAKDNIERCKKLINDIIKRGANPSPNDPTANLLLKGNIEVYEMRLPGNKCGLIIGKGGENIKRLSEQYGVKLVVIQEQNTPLSAEKPLRITGEPDKVAKAKEAVLALVYPEKYAKPMTNDYGTKSNPPIPGAPGEVIVKVAYDKAGVVIGKGGESIKEINRRSGAYVEIDKNHKLVPEGQDKMFTIKGTTEQIQYAQQLIYEKITGNVGGIPPSGFFGPGALEMTETDYSQAVASQAWAGYQWPAAAGLKTEDQNAAAWAAYYQQYYGAAAAGATAAVAASSSTTSAATAQAGQADYSQAWIDYYRQLGMHEQAEAIEKQLKQGQSATGSASNTDNKTDQSSQPTNGTSAVAAANGAAADPYANAAAWQQYSQYNYANYYKQENGSRNA